MRISDCRFKKTETCFFSIRPSAIRIPQSLDFAEAAAINYNPTRKENEGAPEIFCFD
jgi:hypothetical protein